MPLHTELLFIGLFLIPRSFCICDNMPRPKIAIVGAGIGGASISHFLTKLFDRNVEIDVFEGWKVGGRLNTVKVEDNLYEAGGSVIHPRNKYMKDFVKLLRLEKKPSSRKNKFAIWNGDKFVFAGNDTKIIADIYDKGNVSKLFRSVNSFLDNFENIYDAQDNGLAFENVDDLISAMNPNFPKLLQISTAEYFRSLGLSNKIIDELIKATLVENYGQDTDVHSFVGSVSVAGAGATSGGGLWSVKGGNEQVPVNLIKTNPRVKLEMLQVTEIRYLLNEQFQTRYEISAHHNQDNRSVVKNVYDVVVIAAPMTMNKEKQIKFVGFPGDFNPSILKEYKMNYKTFVKNDLNPKHFPSNELQEQIGTIISCNPSQTVINSISKQMPVDGSTEIESAVWKISSANPLAIGLSEKIFSNFQIWRTTSVKWNPAYPQYSTTPHSDKFELYDSLYHVNAIEWAASAMEMSAIGGRNVALLIRKKLTSHCRNDNLRDDIEQRT